jgi:PAS domain S-box-containing protein
LVLTISVLYVDDEPGLLDIGKLFLEGTTEFTVTTALSASVALDLLKSNGIQAIVSDYQMPGMDGIGFLKQVRATDKIIPFILFTGRGREEIAIEAFENGADFYLQKGGDPRSQFAELMHKIKAAVDHRQDEAQVTILNRLYTVLSATNKAIIRIHDKTELLDDICRIVVDKGGFTMAWAGIANPVNRLIEPMAVHGLSEGYLDRITISIDDGPWGQGPTSTAFRDGTYNVCNDIATDERMKPVRESALKRGYRSLAAFPFALDTRNAGVITFYASVSGFFTDQIVRLLDEQSSDLSFAFVTFDHEEQRITAENDLKTSELQYRRLFQTAQDAILILDGDTGKVIDANKFILDMLGYPLEYFVGKHLWELGFIKDKSIAQNAFTELKTNGYIRYEDIPLEKNDGESFNVEFISNVYLVGDKKIIQCNIRDITDKKVVQDALRASEIRYRRLFETAQDGILILDAGTGQIVEVNPFLIAMLGFSHEQFLGKKLWEIGLFKDIVANKDNFEELQQKAYIRYEDLPLETADGRYINVEFISNVYHAGTKKIIQYNVRDITARKRAEAALAESDARLNSILEGSPMMQFVIDKDHRVIFWNKALEECSGVKKAEVLGTRIPWMAFYDTERPVLADLLVDEKVELLPEWYQGTVTHSRLVEGAYETTDFFPKMGVSGMWLYFTAAPIRNASGAIIGAVETLEDITERKLAEEALLRANRNPNDSRQGHPA